MCTILFSHSRSWAWHSVRPSIAVEWLRCTRFSMHRRVQASFFKYGGKPLTTNKSETEAKFSCCRSHIRLKLLPDLFISSFFLSPQKVDFSSKKVERRGKRATSAFREKASRVWSSSSIGSSSEIPLAENGGFFSHHRSSWTGAQESREEKARECVCVCVHIHESECVRICECVCVHACQRQREVEAVRQWKKNWWLMVSESDASCVLKMFLFFFSVT